MYCDFRDKKRVQDVVLEKQNDKAIGQVFGARMNWQEMLDAVSDVYIGVCFMIPKKCKAYTNTSSSLLSGLSSPP